MSFVNRFVAINKESSYGTTGGTYYYGEVDDESFKHQYDLLTRDDLSRYGAAKSVTGKEYSSGDFNLALINDNFTGQLLKGIFPTDTVGSISGGLYPHVFTEAGDFPTFTIVVGRETKEHYYKGCVVDSLSVSANINEYGMVSASMVGKAESTTEDIGTLTASFADSLDALYFADAKVFFDGDSTASNAVKSISFDINLNVDTDNACGLGDATYIRQPPSQRREISGTIEFNRILHDGAGASNPNYGALIETDGLKLDGSGVELKVQFGSESVADILTFNFYKIRFEAPESNVSGRDTQTMSVPFVALYSPDDSKMMDCTLQTALSTAY